MEIRVSYCHRNQYDIIDMLITPQLPSDFSHEHNLCFLRYHFLSAAARPINTTTVLWDNNKNTHHSLPQTRLAPFLLRHSMTQMSAFNKQWNVLSQGLRELLQVTRQRNVGISYIMLLINRTSKIIIKWTYAPEKWVMKLWHLWKLRWLIYEKFRT